MTLGKIDTSAAVEWATEHMQYWS